MDVVVTILGGLLVLTILVVAHEFGHFIVGKKCGIGIVEFAVGFGPKLLLKVKNGIRYTIRLLPLGGFVNFVGEDEDIPHNPSAFHNVRIGKRALTLLAGPVFNLLFALLVTVVVLTAYGDYTPVIHEVMDAMPAQQAGLQEGDRIVQVNGTRIDFMMEFSLTFLQTEGESVTIGVERAGQRLQYEVPFADMADGSRKIGITYAQQRHRFSFFEAVGLSFKWLWLIVCQMLAFLGGLIFAGQGASDVAGPVGTISIIGVALRSGFEVVLRMAALLSINLAVMNLLPFPALDGGRLVFLGVEAIRRKPIARKKEGIVNLIGLIILFGLMALLTYQDIMRLLA